MRTTRTSAISFLVVFFSAGLCTFTVQQFSQNAANRAVLASLAAWPGATVAVIDANPLRGAVRLGGVAWTRNGIKVTADTIILPLATSPLAFIAPAFAAENTVSADNLVVDMGFATYSIKHIEISGTSMSTADLTALIDPHSAVAASKRLAALNAAAIVIPEIVGTINIAGVSETITYRDVKLIDIVNGKIGAATAANTTIAANIQKAGTSTGMIANLTIKNLDMALAARVMTEARKDANEPLQTMFDSFSADSFVLKEAGGVGFSVGQMSGQGYKARAMATPYLAMVAKFAAMSKNAIKTTEQSREFTGFYTDLMQSFAIASIEMRDLAVNVNAEGKSVVVKLTRMAMNGFGDGRLGEIAYSGFGFDSGDTKLSLGTVSLRGLDYRPLLALGETYALKGEEALSNPEESRKFVPLIEHFDMSTLAFDVAATAAKGDSSKGGKQVSFKLGAISYDGSSFISGVPTTAAASIDHFTMDIGTLLNDPDLKAFADLGYTAIDLSSKSNVGWNEATQQFLVKNFSLGGVNMGEFSTSATFGNVPKELFSANTSQAMAAVLGAVINKFEVYVVNQGLLEKAIAAQAKKAKKTPDDIRKTWIATAAVGIPAMFGNAPAGRTIANAVAKFIADPKNLRLTITSAPGLGASDMALLDKPAELLNKVEVVAKVNE